MAATVGYHETQLYFSPTTSSTTRAARPIPKHSSVCMSTAPIDQRLATCGHQEVCPRPCRNSEPRVIPKENDDGVSTFNATVQASSGNNYLKPLCFRSRTVVYGVVKVGIIMMMTNTRR